MNETQKQSSPAQAAMIPEKPKTEPANGTKPATPRGPTISDFDAEQKKLLSQDTPDEMPQFELRADGVYFVGEPKSAMKICSPLKVVAETQTKDGENYGRLLEWHDSKKRLHIWAMPIELVHSDSKEHIKYLVSRGLELLPGKKTHEKLSLYLATSKPKETKISTDKIGWHHHLFVLPEITVGKTAENESVIFQSVSNFDHRFKTSGSLTEWQQNVARLCVGNSRLVFAVSVAFASALLTPLVENGGGFHLRGASSLGKSTGLLVAGSVWGGDERRGFLDTWRTTANGLEAVAELHNDSLLCLDELKECEPRTASEVAYMLANGQGKGRMSRSIAAKKSLTWNLLFLSSGELSLSDLITLSGGRTYAGQEVRMCDIPADAEKGSGLFEQLHEFATAELFAKQLQENSKNFYGTAIREFLQQIIENLDALKSHWVEFRKSFMAGIQPEKTTGEVQRVASRFALVAFAGELARNICGWSDGEAAKSSVAVFQSWLNSRGTLGQADAERAVEKVRHFLESHGNARFQKLDDESEKITNRAGFRRKNPTTDETEFLIYPGVFRSEICQGFDYRFVTKELAMRGFLIKSSDGKNTQNAGKIDGVQQRLYVLSGKIFEHDKPE